MRRKLRWGWEWERGARAEHLLLLGMLFGVELEKSCIFYFSFLTPAHSFFFSFFSFKLPLL